MAMIMQGGEMLKLVGVTCIRDAHDGTEEKHPTYILVSSRAPHAPMDKILVAQKGDAFEQVGVIGFRDPNDRYSIESHKTYIQVPKERVDPKTNLTDDESDLCQDAGSVFLNAMKKYMKDGFKL